MAQPKIKDSALQSPGGGNPTQAFQFACSDETTPLTTATSVVKFRMPYAFNLTGVRASLGVAQTTGSLVTVNIKMNGTTIFSTPLTFDNNEKTTKTAATAAVLSITTLTDDAEITADVTVAASSVAAGLKVSLIGTQ